MPVKTKPFAHISPAGALSSLRRNLQAIDVEDAHDYGTHAMRRGHAQDLVQRGASLVEILHAGEWRSAAFRAYLHTEKLEASAIMEAHYEGSGDEEM